MAPEAGGAQNNSGNASDDLEFGLPELDTNGFQLDTSAWLELRSELGLPLEESPEEDYSTQARQQTEYNRGRVAARARPIIDKIIHGLTPLFSTMEQRGLLDLTEAEHDYAMYVYEQDPSLSASALRAKVKQKREEIRQERPPGIGMADQDDGFRELLASRTYFMQKPPAARYNPYRAEEEDQSRLIWEERYDRKQKLRTDVVRAMRADAVEFSEFQKASGVTPSHLLYYGYGSGLFANILVKRIWVVHSTAREYNSSTYIKGIGLEHTTVYEGGRGVGIDIAGNIYSLQVSRERANGDILRYYQGKALKDGQFLTSLQSLKVISSPDIDIEQPDVLQQKPVTEWRDMLLDIRPFAAYQ